MNRWFILLGLVACTPAERQKAADDGSVIAAGFAQCVMQHVHDQGATAQSVAVMCGVEEVPAAIALIADELKMASQKSISEDAGTP